MQNKKITTLIAIAVVLGVVWLWNEGLFGNNYSSQGSPEVKQPTDASGVYYPTHDDVFKDPRDVQAPKSNESYDGPLPVPPVSSANVKSQ